MTQPATWRLRRVLASGDAAGTRAGSLARATGAELRLAPAGEATGPLPGEARAWGADLLVTCPPRDPGSGALRLASGDWELLRHAPCPVLLARPGDAPPYARVLVAVDPLHVHDKPAALDDALIAAARALAPGARLTLAHCYLPPEYVPFRAPGAPLTGVLHRGQRSPGVHVHELAELARRHDVPRENVCLEPGDPREALPDVVAATGADLLVMGAMARGRLKSLLIGSSTAPVLARVACDVLVLRAAD